MAIKSFTYDSWRHFKADIFRDILNSDYFRRGCYLFRGQMDANWRLSPSFDRWLDRSGDRSKRTETAQALLEFFRRECEALDITEEILRDRVRLMVLGQHYGLPTRLLDWSESIYIAAFFAFCDVVSNNVREGSVAIWALNLRSNVWQGETGVEIIEVSSSGNTRLRHQAGKFTLSKTPFPCLEDYVASCGEEGEGSLVKIILPVSEAKPALADLDAMGINHSRIFPELAGCAMAAMMRILLKE